MKSNRFQKYHILENNTFQKQQQMKKKQISKNDRSQKRTDLKKEQISKKNKFRKIGMIKSYFLELAVFFQSLLFSKM